jgi:hypothetical protein
MFGVHFDPPYDTGSQQTQRIYSSSNGNSNLSDSLSGAIQGILAYPDSLRLLRFNEKPARQGGFFTFQI